MTQRWKELEKNVADKLGGTRINRVTKEGQTFDLYTTAPDVIVNDFGLVIDCKAHKKSDIASKMLTVQRKYCHKPGEFPCVVTQTPRGTPYATVPLDFLAGILANLRRLARI